MTLFARWIACGFAAVLGLAMTSPASAARLGIGQPAPVFVLRTLDGRTLTNASFRGKTLVINVWASWCPPCRMETPDLIAEASADPRRVAFVGVDTTETAAVARAFTAAKGVTYPQVVTSGNSSFARDYDIRNYPTTFVIDANGVLRARHADNLLPRAQLRAYIAAGLRGRSAPLVSEEQRKLDALLDPRKYPLTGDPAAVAAGARAAADAIGAADAEMDDAMTDPARDHDLVATNAREQTLREAAIAALTRVADSDKDRALLARLRGDRDAARGDWSGAGTAYAAALRIDPNDGAALSGAEYAASRRGDNEGAAAFADRIAATAPSYASEIGVARAQARLGHRAAALAAVDRAVALVREHGTAAHLAWTHLYGGRTAVQVGDVHRAQHEFSAAAAAAAAIPHADPRFQMYLEQAQEGNVALTLLVHTRAGVSLAPWTGPELPGSIPSTLKYRLAVTGRPAASIDLAALGLPKGWIGSFCSDRLCSPFTTSVVVPAGGVKIVEFQVIPDNRGPARQIVRIEAEERGRIVAETSAVVTR